MANGAVHVDENVRHDALRQRRWIIQPLKIRLRRKHVGAFDNVVIEKGRRRGDRLMPPPEQKSGDGQTLLQMLALKPRIQLGLAAFACVVEDGENARRAHVAATTMISSL